MEELFLIALLFFQVPAAQKVNGISGRVTFPDGAAASGTVMRAVPLMESGQTDVPVRRYLAVTDAAGKYGFNVAPGRYYLRMEESGNVFTYFAGIATESDAMPVTASDTTLENMRFNAPISGFSWSVIAAGSKCVAAAVPESQSTGRFGYFALPDAIIRYSMTQFLSPQGQGGRPVS